MRVFDRIDIKALNGIDWSFRDADTSYLTHGIHRYSGKYIPQMARILIETLTEPGGLVIDPFVGSGTTLVEAMLLGRRSIGVDLSPIACLVAKAKTTRIPAKHLDTAIMQHLESVRSHIHANNGQLSLLHSIELNPDLGIDSTLRKWFQPSVLRELKIIKPRIDEIVDPQIKTVCEVAFSDILRQRSNASGRYPNVMFDRHAPNKEGAYKQYQRRLTQISEAVKSLDRRDTDNDAIPKVLLGDARILPLADQCADAIVTHPPYIGSVPYAEYQALSLMWHGTDPRHLDGELIGGRRQSRDVVERFLAGMRLVILEIRRVLKKQGMVGVVIGNPTVKGELIRLNEIMRDLFVEARFECLGEIEREKLNMRANKMSSEFVQFFSVSH